MFLERKFGFIYGINPLYAIIDFLGLAHFFGTPSMNATWRFMGVIIVFYILFPILYKLQKYSAELFLVISFAFLMFPSETYFYQLKWCLFPFTLGMYISKYNGFSRLEKKIDSNIKRVLICLLSLFTIAYIRYAYFDHSNAINIDGFFAITIILTSFLILSKIPVLNKILEEMGKYSAQIFMFHTFIKTYYFKDFIYWFQYPIIIFVVLCVICYIVARLLEWLKHMVQYDKLLSKLIKSE